MKEYIIFILIIFCLSVNAQKTNHDYKIQNFDVKFIRTGIDGTILFKVISIGRNTDQAVRNAKADAIKAVLFQGIPNSDLVKPIILDQEIFEKKSIFIESFFKNEKYLDFLTIANDGGIAGEDRIKFNGKYKIGVIVSVNKKLLREYLEHNNIINKLSEGF
jgi:hypothetical protein